LFFAKISLLLQLIAFCNHNKYKSKPTVMKNTVVRYKLWPGRVAENEELVKAVYLQLHELKPAGVHYATFKLQDGVTFQHVASFDTEDAHIVFRGLSAFKTFQADVKDRCEVQPVAVGAELVGSFGF
jgi:hypothetical protein